ncbi:PREDICTED: eukaryotic translation initiation factor 3 subunit G-like [Camelina sativa]|uniref:Eukaryotic translation initiation factor 3 subunit G n=1 Tax=Camelina sativa TaxID=90675 RepID=A0ABM0UA33_CAMSA|nr:PREDICTED: eukaryotic translation initiation factor 3 subunit G-like [Camelina sativa]
MIITKERMMEKTNKVRWGEMEEDDEKLDFLLPPKQVIGPDKNGIKKVIKYFFTEDNKMAKVMTTIRVRKVIVRTCVRMGARSKRIAERRTWAKFGDAVHDDDDTGGSRLTTVSTEEILLERPKALSGTKAEETKASPELGKPGAVLMICRNCGKKGQHWTARCPENNHSSIDQTEASKWTAPARTDKVATYVPPSMREGAEKSIAVSNMRRRRNDENSVRVNNLSEDAREPDLMDLFRSFGDVSRAYVALDKKTGTSRGFGFVNFVSREDAQRAINKLNGYGYDNLILGVEWATPRPTN